MSLVGRKFQNSVVNWLRLKLRSSNNAYVYGLYVWLNKMRFTRKSYSQMGEDCIVRWIFNQLRIKHPTYMDIGAHDPFLFSNTAMFYEEGSRGINIEPNPLLFKRIARKRKGDVNLQIGIGPVRGGPILRFRR